MKRRESSGSQPSDLLVCFPSRAHHLTLMQKPICSPSPARPTEQTKKKRNHHQRLKISQGSPSPWAKNKQINSEITEPTSPKVTCAGQIKIKHKTTRTRPCKSCQSVMDEIERIHQKKKRQQQSWAESLGFKKEVMQLLTCLRNLKLHFHCVGTFPTSAITAEEDAEEYQQTHLDGNESSNKLASSSSSSSSSGTVFSRWFMVLQENQNSEYLKNGKKCCSDHSELSVDQRSGPPPNALLLMRCSSAPAKEWLKERNEEHEGSDHGQQVRGSVRQLRLLMEEEKIEEEMKRKKEDMMVMKYDTDIAKENWSGGGGGMEDSLSMSRSWKS